MPLLLEEVSKETWTVLKEDLTKRNNPETLIIRSLIDMGLTYPLEHKIYQCSRNGSSFLVVTGASTAKRFLPLHIYWPEGEFTEAKAVSLLQMLPNWEWKRSFLVFADPLRRQAQTRHLLQNEKLMGEDKELHQFSCEGLYILRTKEKDLPPFSLPKGFKFGKLHSFQIPWIFSRWDFSFSENVERFRDIIKILSSVAVYKEMDDEHTHFPVSWVLQYPSGLIGMMHTLPQYRRLGLSKAAMTKLIKEILERRHQVLLMIEDTNKVSVDYHVNYGFEKVLQTNFFTLLPKGSILKRYYGKEEN